MSPSPIRPGNVAGRAGAFSGRHWKRATFGWLAFAIAAVMLGGSVGAKSLSDSEMASGEAARAERILASAGFNRPAMESVLIRAATIR